MLLHPSPRRMSEQCTLRKQLRSFCLVMGSDREEDVRLRRQSGSVTYFTFSFWNNLQVTFLLLLTDKSRREGKIWEIADKTGCCKKSTDCGVHRAAFQGQFLSWTKRPPLLQLSQLSKGLFCDVNQKVFNYLSGNWVLSLLYSCICLYAFIHV